MGGARGGDWALLRGYTFADDHGPAPALESPLSLLSLLPALMATASAQTGALPTGLAVHLDAGSRTLEGPVSLALQAESGERSELALSDDGQPPDVMAADGMWSGVGVVGGSRQVLTLTAANLSATSETIPLASGGERNLDLVLVGDVLQWGGPQSAANPAPVESEPGAPADPVDPVATVTTQAPGPAAPPSDLPLYLALALGGLVLGLIGYFGAARLPGQPAAGALPEGVRRAPAQGLLGPGTPPLAPGLSRWGAADSELAGLQALLVGHLARMRPVLVHGPLTADLPPNWGGPVFCADSQDAEDLAEMVEELHYDHPQLVLVTVGLGSADLEILTDALDGLVPVCALVPPAEAPVCCRKTDEGWVVEDPQGVRPVPEPPAWG